jgi:hypothetical protein
MDEWNCHRVVDWRCDGRMNGGLTSVVVSVALQWMADVSFIARGELELSPSPLRGME